MEEEENDFSRRTRFVLKLKIGRDRKEKTRLFSQLSVYVSIGLSVCLSEGMREEREDIILVN